MRWSILPSMFLAALGCSDNPDDPGSGTGTLFVFAEGVIATDFTDLALEVTARGIPVVDAEIRLRDGEREQEARAEPRQPGFYVARLAGAVRILRLEIEAGEDRLSAGIGGPEAFTITRPPEEAVVRSGDASRLLLQWTRPEDEPMEAVELGIVDADDLVIASERLRGDPGEGRVPLPSAPGVFRAFVERTDTVELAGGTEGSVLSLARAARVRFELVP